MVESVSMSYAIETCKLTKYYGKRRGIEHLNLAVPRGCIYGFLGPNGAGKTTTIRLLLGLIKPTSGTAQVAGMDITKKSMNVRSIVGYLPGEVRLFNHLNGCATLKYLSALRGLDCQKRAEELAETLNLDLSLKVRSYSRGMRQKLGFIQAMMHDPKILILDEPTSSLDPLVQQIVYEILKKYALNGGTVFFSSHIINEVERICNRVAIVRDGRLVEEDSIEQLRKNSIQHIRLVLRAKSKLAKPLPEGFTLISQEQQQVHLLAEGSMNQLTNYLKQLDLEFLTIEPPNLEEVFLKFYRIHREDDEE